MQLQSRACKARWRPAFEEMGIVLRGDPTGFELAPIGRAMPADHANMESNLMRNGAQLLDMAQRSDSPIGAASNLPMDPLVGERTLRFPSS